VARWTRAVSERKGAQAVEEAGLRTAETPVPSGRAAVPDDLARDGDRRGVGGSWRASAIASSNPSALPLRAAASQSLGAVACAGVVEEGRVEPGLDLVLLAAISVCSGGADETGGAVRIVAACRDCGEAEEAFGRKGQDTERATDRRPGLAVGGFRCMEGKHAVDGLPALAAVSGS
jgi:hypothetical protein